MIAEVPDDVTCVAIVGHNPSTHGLAITLGAGLREGYPTCGIAIFDVPGGWADLDSATAALRTFHIPRA